jgi:hypothetical protein
MRCFDIAMRELYPFFETQLKPRHEHCEMLAAYIIPIAARPTLMWAPTNQPHRQNNCRAIFNTIHLSFLDRHPLLTTATHHALTLFVERRICVTISCFRRERVAGSGTKKIIREESMLKTALALAAAVFVLAAAPSSQAAPTAGLLAAKSTQNLVEPVYLRRHWRGYRYWRRPVYWGHRHYYRPVYWRHRHYYRYWGPARRHCGWW